MAKEMYGATQGEKNKLKYIKNYERNKYYNGYNKTFKTITFSIPIELFEEISLICKENNITKKDMFIQGFNNIIGGANNE